MAGISKGGDEESSVSLELLKMKLADFAKERNWERFHSPRNLLLAMDTGATMDGDAQNLMMQNLREYQARQRAQRAAPAGDPMPQFQAAVPREMQLGAPTTVDPTEAIIAEYERRSFRITEVDARFNGLPDITEGMKAAKMDFADNELIDQPGIILDRMAVDDIAALGRWVIPMLSSGFSESGAAALFVLAYHLRDPGTLEEEYVLDDGLTVGSVYDKAYNELSDRAMIAGLPYEALRATEDPNAEATAYAFIAASVLRLFTKSEENYVRAFNHIVLGYEKFYGVRCPITPPNPTVESIRALSSHFGVNRYLKMTLYKLLYLSGGSNRAEGMRRFLYDIHLAYTGMHIVSIFIRLCGVLNCSTGVMLTVINSKEFERQIEALASMIQIIMNNSEHHARKMWKFGRIFDESFMSPLQTRSCPMLTYILAYALKSEAAKTNKDILNIVQLEDISAKRRMVAEAIARKILQTIRQHNNDNENSVYKNAQDWRSRRVIRDISMERRGTKRTA